MSEQDELVELSAALRAHLEVARAKGKTRVAMPAGILPSARLDPIERPDPIERSDPVERSDPRPSVATAPSPSRVPPPKPVAASRGNKLPLLEIEAEPADFAERARTLAELAKEVSICRRCGLCETRTQTVFSRGHGRTRVMFIGEAPGADEDAQGFPFVGRAGQLLDQIIDAAGFTRDEIYVANILKCRPPNNRDPKPEETAACTPYLEKQIELVNPKIICALGKHAAQFLTGNPDAPMGKLRGRIHYYRDRIMVLPTYHPAALLRNPGWKRVVWEDVQLLRQEYLRS